MYPPELTEPMRAELTTIGVASLRSPDEVDQALQQPGTTLVFVNSVCGCAAGMARPGLALALDNAGVRPDRIVSVFAGVDGEATQRARQFFAEFPPSSPSAALLKDGEVVWMLHRHQIEGRTANDVAASLIAAWQQHCVAASA